MIWRVCGGEADDEGSVWRGERMTWERVVGATDSEGSLGAADDEGSLWRGGRMMWECVVGGVDDEGNWADD